MQNKVSLRCLDNAPELQDKVTGQAMVFAEMLLMEAKRNKLTPEQVARELDNTGTSRKKNHRSGAR